MRRLLKTAWNKARNGFWFIPTVFTITAILLSWFLVYVDISVAPDLGHEIGWLFGGTAGGARDLLSAIASSLITAISVTFSVTIVALQQASSQYSPRILRNFTQDRGNQATLGSFLGTFIYALLVMRQVRSSTNESHRLVPALAVTFAIVLTLISIGFLIYFIHHISHTIQLSSVLNSILEEVHGETERLYPEPFGEDSAEPDSDENLLDQSVRKRQGLLTTVEAHQKGYLQGIERGAFKRAIKSCRGEFVHVKRGVGDYLFEGTPLIDIWSDHPLTDQEKKRIQNTLTIDIERSIHQDALFGIRQIVDIGLRALSPGVNDPTTAEQCISALGAIIEALLKKKIPSPLQWDENVGFLFKRPSLEDALDLSFGQLKISANANFHVSSTLLRTLEELSNFAPSVPRLGLLIEVARSIRTAFAEGSATQSEKESLERLAQDALARMNERNAELLRTHLRRTA